MTFAMLGQNADNDQLCRSDLRSNFDSAHGNRSGHNVGLVFEVLEDLAQLAEDLLKVVDFSLGQDESELHMRAGRLARELGSFLHEAAVQRLSFDEQRAGGKSASPARKAKHSQGDDIPSLTPRQREVFELLVKGMSNKEIARSMGLGEGTVKIHISGIFRALGVSNRAGAAFIGGSRSTLTGL